MTIGTLGRPVAATTLCLALGLAGPLPARQPAAAGQPEQFVAVIDNDRVLQESNPGRAARQRLEESANQWQERIDQKRQELDALQQQRQQQALTLSPEALRRLEEEIEEAQVELDRLRDDAQREFTRLRDQVLSELEQTLVPILQRLAQERGYQLILNSQTPGLLYYSPLVDATDELIALVNEVVPPPSAQPPGRR